MCSVHYLICNVSNQVYEIDKLLESWCMWIYKTKLNASTVIIRSGA